MDIEEAKIKARLWEIEQENKKLNQEYAELMERLGDTSKAKDVPENTRQ